MSTRLRPGGAVVFAIAVATALAVGPVSPAGAASSEEERFLTLTNQLRASVGAPPLALDGGLSAVARQWAGQMVAAGGISHNPNIANQIADWRRLGENVGMGPSVDSVHNALVNSPPHYANLVNPEFELVGIGVARSGDGYVWVVQNFVQAARPRPAPVYVEPVYDDPPPPPAVEEPAWEPEPEPAPPPRGRGARPAPTPTAEAPAAAEPEPAVDVPVPELVSVDPADLARLALGLELVRALDSPSAG